MIRYFTKRTKVIFCLLLFFYAYQAGGQTAHKDLIEAYNNVLDLRYRQEIPALESFEYQSVHDQVFKLYILNLKNVLDLLLVYQNDKYASYSAIERDHLKALNDISRDDPFVEYVKIEFKVHRGLVKIMYGDRVSGAFNLIQAFRQLTDYERKYAGYTYTLKISGLLNILLSLFPDRYDWVLKMLQVDPDFTKGLNYLKELSGSDSVFKREGILLYALSLSFYGSNPAESEKILNVHEKSFNNSLLYNYLEGLTSIKNRNNEAAIQAFDHCLEYGRDYLQIPALNYYRAEAYLKELNFNRAAYLYNHYLDIPDGGRFIKDSNYKLFNLSKLFSIPDDNFTAYREAVLTEGNLITGSDNYAYRRISRGYEPDSTLFISRLLFDGGYYERSNQALSARSLNDYSNTEDRCEFLYRYARNFQMMNQVESAIDYFNQVLDIEGAEFYYFWGNSVLNLGNLYSKTGEYTLAREFYQRALDYKGESYKNSIRAEARAGLKKIEQY